MTADEVHQALARIQSEAFVDEKPTLEDALEKLDRIYDLAGETATRVLREGVA